LLLNCSLEASDLNVGWRSLPEHRDEEQVQRDVDRAFVHYPSSMCRPCVWLRYTTIDLFFQMSPRKQ
jgi:hypothetical protein